MLNRVWRLARNGLAAALAVGVAGWALERSRFGASDEDALRRMEAELRQRLAQGVGMLSEDRAAEGVALGMTIADNITLSHLGRSARFGWVDRREQRSERAGDVHRDYFGELERVMKS